MFAGTIKATFEVANSNFINNTADSYGGSLYFTPGVTATVEYSMFENVDADTTRPTIGNKYLRLFKP